MKASQLASPNNLRLAWRRLSTGGNYQYKTLYRNLYHAYEVALEANLRDLRLRLLGGAYEPRPPEWIFVPKASGLHRPIALLSIEDQIVLQAFANLAARRMERRRSPLQFQVVFSNILADDDSPFFFRRWQHTYAAFKRRIGKYFKNGMRWIGEFDLAAFYDTISHELLLRTIYPRTSNDDLEWFGQCLRTWSSARASSCHGHGLPQGPLASDFLAECFLLPIDLALQNRRGYIRYVDDIRLFGSTEEEVRADLIELESQCRQRGLIPQTGKYAISRLRSVTQALDVLPSIADPHHEAHGAGRLSPEHARRLFRSALEGRPLRITDKTRLRYVLYRAPPDSQLLNLVLRLAPRHPEHTDAFFSYIGTMPYRRGVERLCMSLVERSPYAYVRGEAWHVLARYRHEPRSLTSQNARLLTSAAIDIAKAHRRGSFAELWGVCHFLCVSEELTSRPFSRFLQYQTPLLQAVLAPALPDGAFTRQQVVQMYLRRSNPEPGLSVAAALHRRGLSLSAYGIEEDEIPSQVANALRELGVVTSGRPGVDPVAEVLYSRYGIKSKKSWHNLLGSEYAYAMGLLKQAEAAFESGPSIWLAFQNSFNNAAFLAVQIHLHATGDPAACRTRDKSGKLLPFGTALQPKGPFARHCPRIALAFREANTRRNALPTSHPYEQGSTAQSRYLTAAEKRRLVDLLAEGYADLAALIP